MSVRATRLLVLGTIRLRQPTHGYDIQRELTAWNADQWANIARPSVYNQLRSLSRDGFVAVTSVEQSTKRPSKTLYVITEEGEEEFGRLLNEVVSNEHPQPLDLLAALCFLPSLTESEVVDAVTKRVAIIKGFLESFDKEMESWFQPDSRTNYIQEIFLLTREAFVAECRWAEGFLERVSSGTYTFADRSVISGKHRPTDQR